MQPLTLLSVVAVHREEHTARAFLACVQQLRTPGLHTVPTRHLQHQQEQRRHKSVPVSVHPTPG
jgi:hypothetical protein